MEQYKRLSIVLSNKPHGWIQFKGTDLCMDVHCSCGEMTHIDDMGIYFLRCNNCDKVYELNPYIQLIERKDKFKDPDINKSF